MNLTISLKNIFKRKHQQSLYKHEFHAYRDWGFMLIFFVLGFVGLALFHIYFFLQVTTAPHAVIHTVNKANLKKVVDTLDARTAFFQSERQTTHLLVDPSR